MVRFTEGHRAELLDKIVEAAVKRLGEERTAAVTHFLRHYYAHVSLHDIHGETPETLFAIAFSHYRLAAQRDPGTPIVRIYNPRLEEHGWRSEHTIIEVVTDDMPFLVDSMTAEVNRHNLVVHRIFHPIVRVQRNDKSELAAIHSQSADAVGSAESFMHIEITHQSDDALSGLCFGVESVLADVRLAVDGWQPMRERLQQVIGAIGAIEHPASQEDLDEAVAFLKWLYENNFTFLGYRAYRFEEGGGQLMSRADMSTALGLLSKPDLLVFDDLKHDAPVPPAVRAFIERPDPLLVTKSNHTSTVHRPVHMDVITVKSYDSAAHVVGEDVFVGLFASPAYNRSARNIPWLGLKVGRVIARAGFERRSHDGRALLNILETFPRDELFQVTEEHLLATTLGILHLQQRQRVALFLRRDDFERFISCLVYVPRDRYSTELRLKIQSILEKAFNGSVTAHYGQLGDSPLARLQFYIRTTPGQIPPYDADELEADITEAARTWADSLESALNLAHGEEVGQQLYARYAQAFPPSYRERFNEAEAVADIAAIEQTIQSGTLGMTLYRPVWAGEHLVRFKIFHRDTAIPLSKVLPLLEHLGVRVLDEIPHGITVDIDGGRTVMIHDFGLETRTGSAVELGAVQDHFKEAFAAIWDGRLESDRFNGLVLSAGLNSRQVVVLRAYCKYLRQARIQFSQSYMEDTLTEHPEIAGLLVELFEALFDPSAAGDRDNKAELLRGKITNRLEMVESADDDRIIRRFLNAIDCTLRTNYFQNDQQGAHKDYVSFKLESGRLDDLPAPRPWVEVFVYAPTVEGVHLRGGSVARGGLRWSDRREDFRTEVLGLMKAQMVKNAVIVPVGAKGGFIVKRPPPASDREAFLAEGVACYKTFIRGLLDITDNLVKGVLVPPQEVVRRDADDPYLVVAADKGTATFSDIANGVAAEYGFWLGDAFASGGSQGYDHKKEGITARGAWESVKRHFREMGTDIQSEDFTCVGVGDMSGDVFGNGMLLSRHIKLLAAFDHRHIFVDPAPDPEQSFIERERLFALPRSSWADYDTSLLSHGGRIFDRRAKSLELTPEMCAVFGFSDKHLTPNQLINQLLKSEVDLLWFGGIGTFIKAAVESHAEAGDRANDAVRVNGAEVRAKVIGEGANLGVTQLGRVEFARNGGRVNADFIDNSAGVDCSDHEVNIKILLDAVVSDGDMTVKQRNELLANMTDEVMDLVLRDNYLQTQAITHIEDSGFEALDHQTRLIRMLERQGRLDRTVEFLPDDEGLAERYTSREGLTRPEIAVLFSYCKIWLYDQVLASDLPDDPHLADDLMRYFPTESQERFGGRVAGHRLKRELIATAVTNSLINRVGGTFVTEVAEKTGMSPVEITRAYTIARDVFAVRNIWQEIEALDNRVQADVQTSLNQDVQRLLERTTIWFLRNGGTPLDISVNVSAFDTVVGKLAESIVTILPEQVNERILESAGQYEANGVPQDLARRVAYLIVMPSACDIVRLAAERGISSESVAQLYFEVGETLGFGWLRYQAEKLVAESHWHKLAVAAIIEELYGHQHDIVSKVMRAADHDIEGVFEVWESDNRVALDRTQSLLNELRSASTVDLPMLTVASRQLRTLTAA